MQQNNSQTLVNGSGSGSVGSASNNDNIEMLMKRMQDLSEKKKECSEMELSNRFKNVELQVRKSTELRDFY